ncbi:MAG: tetratricopeptide repeat protein [Candidatus Kapaibacterium sp.]
MSSTNELRLFISSTFRDMQEEREHLVKKIFPEIRALCRERGITFTEIDLRWGLTDEDVVLGQVVRTCLEEIDKCRPYFIGIVGERYGWSPPLHEYYKDPELFSRWPWLEDAAMEGASITDVEFRHGALNNPTMADHARFFFRRKRRSLDSGDNATTEDEEKEKFDDLKNRVREAGMSVEEFRDPISLGELIYDELIEIIERDFADVKPPTPLEQERSRHTAFAASRRRAYIPNPHYLTKLNEWVTSEETKPLILYAESGSGKSSLVSFWCEQLRRRQPELHIIEHYVGIGAGDSDHLGIIKHVIEEIKKRYDRSEDIPSKPEDLERAFANWLGFNVGSPMLLVIDGINQLSGRALDLHWLPPLMPPGVKLIVSSTVEGTLVDLRARGWSELGMQPLRESEREAVVVRFLAEYSKALSTDQVKRVASDVKSSHPLFLRTLLEELRLHGVHEHLDRTLETLLSATGTEDLFQRVLERLEDDYSQKVVREVLSLIRTSRFGLSEEDLESLTGISRLKLSTLLLGLDYHLVRRDGVLSFFHDYLRRAVEKRYLAQSSTLQDRYRMLAEHFEGGDVTLRGTRELLRALEAMGDRDRLHRELSRVERLIPLWQSEQQEVLRLWSSAELPEIVSAYEEGLSRWEGEDRTPAERMEALRVIGILHGYVGAWSVAEDLYRRLEEIAREQGDRERIATAVGNRGDVHRNRGEYDEAMACYREQEEIARERGDRLRIALATGSRGSVHTLRGEYDEALVCFEEQEKVSRDIGDRQSIGRSIGNRGVVFGRRGELAEAMACFRELEEIARERGDRMLIAMTVNNRGSAHLEQGDYQQALACYREVEEIARDIGDRGNISLGVFNRGKLHATLGEFTEALACYREGEEIYRSLGNRQGLGYVLENRGAVHAIRGEFAEALALFRQATSEFRGIGYRLGLSRGLTRSARVLLDVAEGGDMPEYLPQYVPEAEPSSWKRPTIRTARKHAEESMTLSEELSTPETLFEVRLLLARITAMEGDVVAATSRLDVMLEKATEVESQARLHYWLWKLNTENMDHHAEAMRLYKSIIAERPLYSYQERIDELSGSTTPTTPEANDAAE